MLRLSEALLQFIWQHRLLKPLPLITRSGLELTVLHPGSLNRHAGPDFFDARIRSGNLVMAGNVELHLKTSDWLKHKHDADHSYDKLILHVVYEHDTELEQNSHHGVEVLELKNLIDARTLEDYRLLSESAERLPCASQLKHINGLKFTNWLERMAVERLEEKTARIAQLHQSYNGDYSQVFYTLLLRNFGFGVNAVPFELLAKHLPLQLLLKHADNVLQLEALLLGTAGFLEDQFEDNYLQALQNEYAHLKRKYSLSEVNKELFKFSRMRPANFPSLRLAQLAALIHASPALFTAPQEFHSPAALLQALQVEPQGYWKHHYRPGGSGTSRRLNLGKGSAENILINTFAPFLFFYAERLLKPNLADLALGLLQSAAFESNVKTRLFMAKKEALRTAADSQGLIQLYDRYCTKKRCLNCGIAAALLAAPR